MKSSTAILVVILLLIILSLGGFAFYLWQNQKGTKGEKTSDLGGLILENQEAGWQDFTSPLGYSLTYPANYFTFKNESDTSDLFTHYIQDQNGSLPSGSIYMKRQVTNINDLNRIYSLIEENIKKSNQPDSVLQNILTGRKNLSLEDGTQVIEFDQTGVEETHNVIFLNGGYIYNLGYKSKNADTVLISYFNKMYPSIKFTTGGVAKENWELQTSNPLGLSYRLPPDWVVQETEVDVTIISPQQNILSLTRQKTLSLDNSGKKYFLSASGHNVEITLTSDESNSPVENARGFGQIENTIYLNLNFKAKNATIRKADWQIIQEIIKSISLN